MTSRERWTVYPLLFLALGLAMRAIAVPQVELDAARVDSLESTRLVCKEIVIENDDGTILVHMGRVVKGGGGRIEIKDKDGVDAIAVGTATALWNFSTPKASRQARCPISASGGPTRKRYCRRMTPGPTAC
jgi:hypothetical protein